MVETQGFASWQDLSDGEVVDTLASLEEHAASVRKQIDSLRAEALARMEYRGGTALKSETRTLVLRKGTPSYDVQVLEPLREMLTAADLGKAYTPAHKREVDVPARWDGTQLNRIERQYGGAVADRIRDARIEGAPSVKMEATA